MPAKPKKTKKSKSKKPVRVNPVPPGFGTVTPYLVINGAAQAIDFYKKAFGAKELERQPIPDGKLMHARIKIGDSIVLMSDEFPGSGTRAPSNVGTSTVTLHIYTSNVDKLWQQALDAGAKPTMQLDNTFWGERYGQLVDPFGHRWSVSSRIKMSPKEMEEKRQQAIMMVGQGQHAERPERETAPTLT